MVLNNLVLTGFMGTGKSTVGWLVAQRLGWYFVDADEEIVTRFGMSIPEIFEQHGEDGFRRFESIVCQSLAAQERKVIATGGGMLVNEANLRVMKSTGFVICLTANKKTIKSRLESDGDGRPLAGEWEALFDQRQEAYNRIQNQVDTTDKSPDEIVEEIVTLWENASQ